MIIFGVLASLVRDFVFIQKMSSYHLRTFYKGGQSRLSPETERRGPLLRSCEVIYKHAGKQNFDILIFEILLFFGGLGEPSSAH